MLRCAVHHDLPGHGDRKTTGRHRRYRSRHLRGLQGLHAGLSLRRDLSRRALGHCWQVSLLCAPHGDRVGACLCRGVSHRGHCAGRLRRSGERRVEAACERAADRAQARGRHVAQRVLSRRGTGGHRPPADERLGRLPLGPAVVRPGARRRVVRCRRAQSGGTHDLQRRPQAALGSQDHRLPVLQVAGCGRVPGGRGVAVGRSPGSAGRRGCAAAVTDLPVDHPGAAGHRPEAARAFPTGARGWPSGRSS